MGIRPGHREVTELFSSNKQYKLGEQPYQGSVRVYTDRAGRKETPVLDRMWAKTDLMSHPDFDTPCMPASCTAPSGYASIWYKGRYVLVHRLAMLLDGQTLTSGLTIDHICERKSCWNTLHLEEVTQKVNKQREVARRNRG